jgi:dTDP-4-amino-4,6-dideoxygalactose transaminase
VSKIPLVDLQAQFMDVQIEVKAAIARVVENARFILGEDVAAFEDAFAHFSGVRHCVGVANGTDAIELMLRACRIGPGDEVILPTNTFVATALAVVRAGATPVLVDNDPLYYLIDPRQVEAAITRQTRAILAVHLFGQLAPMEVLSDLAKTRGLILLEDAAQAQGALRDGKPPGYWGAAAATSFYPGKNLGAFGDAGAVFTDSGSLAGRVRCLRNYGSEVKYHHPEMGFNSRLDTIQAAVLKAKLPYLAQWNARRREAAQRYDALLDGVRDVVLPRTLVGNEHIWHVYVIRVPNRDSVLRALNSAGIGAGIHYPVPVHLQGAFKHLGHANGDFPVAERAAAEMISLPMFAEITLAQQEEVVSEVRRALT